MKFMNYVLNEGNVLPGQFKFGFELEAITTEVDETGAIENYIERNIDRIFNDIYNNLIVESDDFNRAESKRYEIEEKIEELKDRLGKLQKQKKQKLTDEELDELEDEIEDTRNNIETLKEKLEDIEADMSDIEEEIATVAHEMAYQEAYERALETTYEIAEIESEEIYNIIKKYFENARDGEVKEDSSIKPDHRGGIGFEYASPVLNLTPKNLNDLWKLLSNLDRHGIYTNDSCGFHIHISWSDISLEDAFWVITNLALDKDAKKKFIEGANKVGVEFFSTAYAGKDFLDKITSAVKTKDTEMLLRLLYDADKYRVLIVTKYKDIEWRGPRNFMKHKDKIKAFIFLLYDFIKWISDVLDRKEYMGISRSDLAKKIKENYRIYGTDKHSTFVKKPNPIINAATPEVLNYIQNKEPWMFKNFKQITVSNLSSITIVDDRIQLKKFIIRETDWKNIVLYDCKMNFVNLKNCIINYSQINDSTLSDSSISNQDESYLIFCADTKFYNCEAISGGFKNCEWHGGVFRGSTFVNSIWYDGVWEGGYWIGSEWKGGTWQKGKFVFKSGPNYVYIETTIPPNKITKDYLLDKDFHFLEYQYEQRLYDANLLSLEK
jgi:hypothetical protein